ncbi:MAG: response regulator [Lachnospiraceae bacterium]|nr:response regulator [Lachnospiraceae bacterium]
MANWIVVVDDDMTNLKVAGHILSKNNKRVTALRSGEALLEFVKENKPDLILLDIRMPEMDGFETFKRLRSFEKETGRDEIPVVFLTADEETSTESRGFEVGVSDYIRKPFDPEILIKRINNILEKQEKLHYFKDEASHDQLTGFLNKAGVNDKLRAECGKIPGYLLMIDLDSFKLVNDIYGHEMGDKILISFAKLCKTRLPLNSTIGRFGGDEFVAYCPDYTEEDDIRDFTIGLNDAIFEKTKELMGDDCEIPLGVSIGAIYVSGPEIDYLDALSLADKALYNVKQNDKHGYSIYREAQADDVESSGTIGLKELSMILAERNIPDSALSLDKEAFISVYRFIMRYLKRYNKNACKLLFTVTPNGEEDNAFYAVCDKFFEHVRDHLRKSDLLMRYRKNKIFVFLTDIKEFAISQVITNIIEKWKQHKGDIVNIEYEIEGIESANRGINERDVLWIAVVDDDPLNLKIAERILTKNNMKTSLLNSGKELLEFIKNNNKPDLILLDVKMEEMDGFETLSRLRTISYDAADIPVIFLTANDDESFEARGLSLGAMDFIRKPFVPEVLVLRVKHIVELIRLQRTLYFEVAKKTKENENLFLHVVESLAKSIDAKDSYTNGHSGRVAEYSREIARRAGYSTVQLSNIYMMALLHDVGKIGVPDAVINKPDRLNEEEFDLIKKHPVIGAQILSNIKEMPELYSAARWHHERYDGGGYPDGLKGDNIPEEVRIITVADAYDAMTSNRSYRKFMSQDTVKAELEKCKSHQFDPRFADIMLSMMNEDNDYNMREKPDR